ncbi:MAG: hypothetical protein ACK6DV_25165 [Deltaproteobacteria bacterium]
MALVALGVWARPAASAALDRCMDGRCPVGDCVSGLCFPDGCELMECVSPGDCDGDLVPNPEDATPCAGLIVTRGDGYEWRKTVELSTTGGATEVAPGVWSAEPDAFAIGCLGTEQRCPVRPGHEARCVALLRGPVGTLGVCTYGLDGRDDTSCVDEPGVRSDGCLTRGGPTNYRSWALGDCDGDGLDNETDPRVCSQLRVIGDTPAPGIELACAPGAVTAERCSPFSRALVVPGIEGCASDLAGSAPIDPFGLCCAVRADCPVLPPRMGASGAPRCVQLPGEETGVCTYGPGAFAADDSSCVTPDRSLETCFAAMRDGYASWAGGNCDGCTPGNDEDDEVCACPDAGLDASVTSPHDAGNASDAPVLDTLDARPLDASDASLDALRPDTGDPTVPFFGGSGCRCAAGARDLSKPAWSTLAAIAGGLVARRRRRRA